MKPNFQHIKNLTISHISYFACQVIAFTRIFIQIISYLCRANQRHVYRSPYNWSFYLANKNHKNQACVPTNDKSLYRSLLMISWVVHHDPRRHTIAVELPLVRPKADVSLCRREMAFEHFVHNDRVVRVQVVVDHLHVLDDALPFEAIRSVPKVATLLLTSYSLVLLD